MTTTCSTVLSQTFNNSSTWSSGHLTVGTFFELTLDITFSSFTQNVFITVSRVDIAGNLIQIWGTEEVPPGPIQESPDFGPSFAYACTRTWGNTLQIDITTTGTFTGSLSLQGKG